MRKQNKQPHRKNTYKTGRILLMATFFVVVSFVSSSGVLGEEWGQIMVAREKTNIRAKRTVDSKLKGFLHAGQKIKADYLKDNWYAVFKLREEKHSEHAALGYVYSPRLKAMETIEKAANAGNGKLEVKVIRFAPDTDEHEKIIIELNRFTAPHLTAIKGKNPRLVIDFENVASASKDFSKIIQADGKLIQRIRSSQDRQKHTFRVVLDLRTGRDYTVTQKFYEAEKLYTLDLSEDKTRQQTD